ncbi:hypothetical protein PHISP_00556 [Aspergillus sp. HF37]|nr:hypothetical protein PHISP_00556 [Aspergillus sp. HF37]
MFPHPPPPPPPPPHFPPGPPGNPAGPRIVQNQAPAPMDAMHLAGQMDRLNINNNRLPGSSSPNANSPRQYEGYTFFKADTFPGQKATWNNAERTRMHLSQNDLLKMVQKRSKKTPASQQYQNLSRNKRRHVDDLIEDLRRMDPRVEWHCVYVKVDEKPVKGKSSRRGDYETVSMDVVIMRKTSSPAYQRTPLNGPMGHGSPTKNRMFGSPLSDDDFTPINRDVEDNVPFRSPGPFHQPMNGPQQPPPPQFPQNQPPLQQGPGMGGPPMFQGPGPRPPMPPGGVHHPSPPGIHDPPPAGMNNGPGFETLNGPGFGPPSPGAPHPGQRPDQMRPPFSPPPNNRFQMPGRPNMKPNHGHIGKPPNIHNQYEPEWGPESSDVEDDESMMFDEDETSGTEDTDSEIHDGFFQPGRGSLHRQHSVTKKDRHAPIYRPHHRGHHSPKYPLDKKHVQKRYPAGHVDLVPASRGANGCVRGPHSRPTIVHGLDAAFDDEYIHDKLRGGRARNDIRTRILDDREARLEQRENILDLQNRALDRGVDDRYYLGRQMQMPLREPCYRGRYLH